MPRVSVLVPSYGHARFLPACLSSLQGQTFEDWEAVVLDDQSPDDSLEVARRFAADDPRFTVGLNPRNLGTYGSLARALGLATGGLIAVLNSDDVWHPEKLWRQVSLLDRQGDAPLVYALGRQIDEEGRDLPADVHTDWPSGERHDLLPRLLEENRVLASGVVFRREAARFDGALRTSGDWVALLEAAWRGPVACVAEPLVGWRQHGSNSYRLSPRQADEEAKVREAILAQEAAWRRRVPGPETPFRLGACSMHLLALRVYFGDVRAARLEARRLLGLRRDRAALRRALAAWLPLGRTRPRMWPGADDATYPEGRTQVSLRLS